MKDITIDDGNTSISLIIDFNKKIIEVMEMLELNTNEVYMSMMSNQMINITESFTQNGIENNDVLSTGENNEG